MTEEIQAKTSEESFDQALAEMFARSQAAFLKYQSTLSDIERSMIGTFINVPPKMESGWIFHRVGGKGSHAHQGMAHMLRQQGWIDAPRGVEMVGTQFWDGPEGAIILCAPQEVYRRMKAIEEAVLNSNSVSERVKAFDGLPEMLDGTHGVGVDKFDVSTDATTMESAQSRAMERIAEIRSRKQSRRP